MTTNGLGTPKKAQEAARAAVSYQSSRWSVSRVINTLFGQVDGISHYPPANFEPHLSHLARFLWPDSADENSCRLQVILHEPCSKRQE